MDRRVLLARALAALLLAAIPRTADAGSNGDGFVLTLAEKGGAAEAFAIAPGARFTISWVHSVEEEAWEETFEVTRTGAIVVHSTRFKTYGAGVPSDGAATTRIKDGWVVMDGIDRVVDPLAVLATPGQDYRLTVEGTSRSLTPDGRPHLWTFAVVDDHSKKRANGTTRP